MTRITKTMLLALEAASDAALKALAAAQAGYWIGAVMHAETAAAA